MADKQKACEKDIASNVLCTIKEEDEEYNDIDDNDFVKDDRGSTNYKNDKVGMSKNNFFSRSKNLYGKKNKARGLRRIADRHSHHRRRQVLHEALIVAEKFDKEPVLQESTTCVQKRKGTSASNICTNSKN